MTTDRSRGHPPAGANPSPALSTAEPERSALEIAVFAGDAVAIHPLPPRGSVSIGRADTNDIRIDDASVSRRHAVLHLGPPLRLEDLGGTNATSVRAPRFSARTALADGARLEEQTAKADDARQISKQSTEITPGDWITVGGVLLVVRKAQVPSTPPTAGDRPSAPPLESGEMVLRDPAMRALYEQAGRAAPGVISVLLLGETGTGKEVLARAIHKRSSPARARGPFLGLNCAALSESLLESELFGHEKGAFTGALQAKPGLFEAADGGTVFLDELGELPKATQVKLLRVLEEHQVLRVGGRVPRSIDVRFISATNRDIEAEVARGNFREDLYFRLNGVTLTIPPLRERIADIAPLANLFTAKASRAFEREEVPSVSLEALILLERYSWPGNIRELRNVMERAVMLCQGNTILPEHLPPKLLAGAARHSIGTPSSPPSSAKGSPDTDPSEKQRIIDALEKCVGNQTYAARLLGISRRTLVSRIQAYDLPRPRKPKEQKP